jgi:tRNA nucleotidyltransferase (CCA-adding enzyme)
MKAYVVGGAVRDELLGLPVADRDWVVVGATPEQMTAEGYRPVGRDFPVFLHPRTKEEYALARTERKSGRGYRGFTVYAAPEVTLEEDLKRRDLTLNAMARTEDGTLIDPFGGRRDLEAGVLRHVSEAFAEDPVRILRVARFAARFDFRVADETAALMRRMVEAGEVEDLVPERVWQEFAKGLAERHPRRLFAVLAECGALARLLPEIRADEALYAALGRAAQEGAPLALRFALLAWPLDEAAVRSLCARLRAPNEASELALAACRCRERIRAAGRADSAALLETLKRADSIRRADRFGQLLTVARLAEPGDASERAIGRLRLALAAAQGVDAAAIARATPSPAEIPARLDRARERAIAASLAES